MSPSLDDLGKNLNLKWYQKIDYWYKENIIIYLIKDLLSSSIFFKLIRRIYFIVERHKRHKIGYQKSFDRLNSSHLNINSSVSLKSDFGYSGDVFFKELSTAHKYRLQIEEKFKEKSESKKLYKHMFKVLKDLCYENKVSSVVNFGVSYAYIDHKLAKEFPEIKFYGIERTKAAKLYNQAFLPPLNNLEIIESDIFKALEKLNLKDSILFTSRTLLLLPSSFILKLYKFAKKNKIRWIVGFEHYGVSRQTRNSYKFSYENQKSVIYKDFMYIHNYPNIIETAGYDLERIEDVITDHPEEDFRILSYTASVKKF